MQEALEFKNFALVKTAVKFRNLQISKKKFNSTTSRNFYIPFQIMCISLRYNLKNNTAVRTSGYLYRVNKKFSVRNAFVFF